MGNGYRNSKPAAAFALAPAVRDDVFPPDVLARIGRVATLMTDLPLTDLTSPSARYVLAGTEILLTCWGCPVIDEVVLAAAPRLRAVIHAAGSVKHLVRPEVFERGIVVSSAAAANARPVAEYTVAMLVLALKRTIPDARAYAAGTHEWRAPVGPSGAAGATIGIVGASHTGRQVAKLLSGYGAHVLVADPHRGAAEIRALGAEPVELDELCSRSHAVTIHAPELPETYHLFDDARLSLMRDGAVLVNTARGPLVDTEALARHCATGRLDAVLDVTDPEPLPPGHPVLQLPNVLVTPHLAGARGRELRLLGEYAAAEVKRLVAGEPLHGRVHAADLTTIA